VETTYQISAISGNFRMRVVAGGKEGPGAGRTHPTKEQLLVIIQGWMHMVPGDMGGHYIAGPGLVMGDGRQNLSGTVFLCPEFEVVSLHNVAPIRPAALISLLRTSEGNPGSTPRCCP
jgi:hypothetical protein